ncbi:MAG: HEPN domain-containing protein [Verrucomicrobiaceae bacterium]
MHDLLKRLIAEASELTTFLSVHGQLSLVNIANDNSRKTLVLSAASLFENRITEALLGYADRASNSDPCIVSMIRIKAIKRQYHTFFDWEKSKASTFYTLLGDRLGSELKQSCSSDPGKTAVAAFLELGQLRNCLVHQNFAEYAVDKSISEICALCEHADEFVQLVESLLAGRASEAATSADSIAKE